MLGVRAGLYGAVTGRAIPVYVAVGRGPQSQFGFHETSGAEGVRDDNEDALNVYLLRIRINFFFLFLFN